MTDKQKDYLFRILKTFAQGVLTYIIMLLADGGEIKDGKSILYGIIAAGLSAVMNLYKLKNDTIEVEDKSEEEFESE